MWMFYAIALPITLGMVVYTLMYYASPKVMQHVRVIVAYAWFVNVSIVILVPLDVWTAICVEKSDPSILCSSKLSIRIMWSFSYWSAFFLTWTILPLMQGYEDAGDFTSKERLNTSVRGNLILIGIVGAVAVIGVIILLVTKEMDWNNIVSLAIGSSNAFALITGALLLGFGLVEIPRSLWRHANLEERQRWLSHKVAKVAKKLDQAHQELSTAIVITQATSLQMPRSDSLRPMMDVVDAMACEDPSFKPSGGQIGENDMDYDTDEKSMAALRRRLRNAQDNYSRYKTEYCTVVWDALELEDTKMNSENGEWRYVSRLRPPRKGHLAFFLDFVEWWWRCGVRNHVVRCLAVLLGVTSVAILFAEATLLSQKWMDLSLFSVLIQSSGSQGELIQLLVFIPLVYLCVCTYFSLFKLGMFSFYYLVPHHTNSLSLLMNCSMVSRYAAPMCYNFLSLIHLRHYNSSKGLIEPLQTVFEKRMGVLPDSFERVYPLSMVIWCILIAGNFHNRATDIFGSWMRRFRFEDDDEVGDETDGCSLMGLSILRKERGSLENGVSLAENVVPLARHFSSKDFVDSGSISLHKSQPTNREIGASGGRENGTNHAAANGDNRSSASSRLLSSFDNNSPVKEAIRKSNSASDMATSGPTSKRDELTTKYAAKKLDPRTLENGDGRRRVVEAGTAQDRSSRSLLKFLAGELRSLLPTTAGILEASSGSRALSKAEPSTSPSESPLISSRIPSNSQLEAVGRESTLESKWDVMKATMKGWTSNLKLERLKSLVGTEQQPQAGGDGNRPQIPSLEHIFEGLKMKRVGSNLLEEEEMDEHKYSLLRAGQNRHDRFF